MALKTYLVEFTVGWAAVGVGGIEVEAESEEAAVLLVKSQLAGMTAYELRQDVEIVDEWDHTWEGDAVVADVYEN